MGTPGRLAQIVTNLVTNSLDALPEVGEGLITLTLTTDDHVARLEVQDNGSGIPSEIRDKVFEPMFSTKPLGEGTGLGLSIVKDLVDGHFGGHVDLASEPGHGTTFTVTFAAAEHVGGPDTEMVVRCSLGAGTLPGRSYDRSEMVAPPSPAYFQGVAEALILSADAALYRAKALGGGQLQGGEPICWPDLPVRPVPDPVPSH